MVSSKHVKDDDRKWNQLLKNFDALGMTVEVGIQSGARGRSQSEILDYALKNEFGTLKIPERSFFRSTMDENKDIWEHQILSFMRRMTALKIKPETFFEILGTDIQNKIKEKITTLREPENSEVTIKLKKSSNPLIDTGAMRASIRYKVVKKQ